MNEKNIEDVKDKITKLLALADSPNEHEAKAALLKARSLMAKHKLHQEDITQKQNIKVIRRLIGISCTKMTNTWATQLSAIIAEHYCCKAYRNHAYGAKKIEIGLVGLEDDFGICEKVYKYAFNCIEGCCKKIQNEYKAMYGAKYIRQMTNAYGTGFCEGLKAAYVEQDKKHQEWGLVLVTPEAVMAAMQDMGKPTGYGKVDRGGWKQQFVNQGYEDGRKFDPSTKLQPVESK